MFVAVDLAGRQSHHLVGIHALQAVIERPRVDKMACGAEGVAADDIVYVIKPVAPLKYLRVEMILVMMRHQNV